MRLRSRVAAALRAAEQQFRLSFENAPIGKALVAPDGRFLRVNRAICQIVGYSADELMAMTFQDITHPDDLDADLEFVRQMLAGKIRTYSMEKRYFHADGHIVWINLSVSLVRDDAGQPVHFISQIEDITKRKVDEEQLRRSNHLLARTQQLARVGSWEWNVTSGPAGDVHWSAEMYRLHGADPETFAITEDSIRSLIHPDDFDGWLERMMHTVTERTDLEGFAYRAIHPDGSERCIWTQASFDPERPDVLVGFVQDISQRRAYEERLEQLALVDELTGLRNRRGFMAVAEPLTKMAEREQREMALVFIDLDNMKEINDRFGHVVGDRALIEAAELLTSTFRATDIVARLGGDEFCVLLPSYGTEAKLDLDRLHDRLVERAGRQYPPLSLSIGVAQFDWGLPITIEELIGLADAAMYSEKLSKRASA